MKRILLILSILMITGVSAQVEKGYPEIHNVSVDTYGEYVKIHWDVDNSRSSSYKRKNSKGGWIPANTPPGEDKSYGIWYRKYDKVTGFSNADDRIYRIKTTDTPIEDKIRVRVIKLLDDGTTVFGNKMLAIIESEHKFNNLIGKKVFIGSDNSKGKITNVTYGEEPYPHTLLEIDLKGKTSNDDYPEFIWFTSKIN